jgi:hypothetical protein
VNGAVGLANAAVRQALKDALSCSAIESFWRARKDERENRRAIVMPINLR